MEFGWSAAGVLHKFDLHPQKSLVVKSAVRQGYALPPRALELSKRPAYHSKIQVNMKFVDLLEDMTQRSILVSAVNHTDTCTDQFSAAISHHSKSPSVPCEACSVADNDQLSQHFVSESFCFKRECRLSVFLVKLPSSRVP